MMDQLQKTFVPQRAIVETHMGCSYQCRHCYQNRPGFRRGRHLSVAQAVSRIRQLKKLGVEDIVPVTGEVLDFPEYLECYRVAGWTEHLVTNGLKLIEDCDLGRRVAETGFRRLRISAHYGTPESLRPHGGNVVSDVVRAAAGHSLQVEAFNLIGTFNYLLVSEMFARARQDGLKKLILINLIPTTAVLRSYALSTKQIRQVFGRVEDLRAAPENRGLKISLFGNFGPRPGSAGERLAKNNCYCPAGQTSVYIAVDGGVYGCHFLLEQRLQLGKFSDGRFSMRYSDDLIGQNRTTCPLLSKSF